MQVILLATIVMCSLRTDFVTIPTAFESCCKDGRKDKGKKEQNVSNAVIEATEFMRKVKGQEVTRPV